MDETPTINPREIDLAGGMLLKKWCEVTGVNLRTTRRWRADPRKNFKVVWRFGMPFLTAETIRNFFVDDGSNPEGPKRPSPSTAEAPSAVLPA
jgi:hypothetical protein